MTARRLLRRFLKPYVADEFLRSTVRPADEQIDRALDQLETEEPSLLDYVSTDADIQRLLSAHSASMHVVVARAMHYNMPMEQVLRRLDGLTYRLVAAVVVDATMRARGEEPDFLKGLPQ